MQHACYYFLVLVGNSIRFQILPIFNFQSYTLTQVVHSYICALEVEYTMCLSSTSIKLYYITI